MSDLHVRFTIVTFHKMKSEIVLIIFLLCFSTVLNKIERKYMNIPNECCLDYPSCNNTDKEDPLSIDAAVLDPNPVGEEILYVFYGNRTFAFTFKDEARNTPILLESKDNEFTIAKDWSVTGLNVQKVLLAYNTRMPDSIVLKLKTEESELIKAFDKKRSEIQSPDSQNHPWLEDDPKAGQMYAAAFMSSHGNNGSLLAFYRDTTVDVSKTEMFNYTVKLWDVDTEEIQLEKRVRGRIVAVADRRPLATNGDTTPPSRGIYFTNDGRACEFELAHQPNINLEIERHFSGGDQAFINSEISPPCSSFTVYLGCPQSFCYQADVDDIAVYAGKYIIFREKFFWTVEKEKHGLPMRAPTVSEKKYIHLEFPYRQGLELVDAAFSFEEDSKQILVTIREDIVKYYENEKLTFTDTDILQNVFEGAPNGTLVDTAAYDDKTGQLMMFFGEKWGYFIRSKSVANKWKLDGELWDKADSFRDSPLYFEGSIDSDHKIHFLYRSYYYTMEKGSEPSTYVFYPAPSLVFSKDQMGIFYQKNCPDAGAKLLAAKYQIFPPGRSLLLSAEKGEQDDPERFQIILTAVGTVLVTCFVLLLGAVFLLPKKSRTREKRKLVSKSAKKSK